MKNKAYPLYDILPVRDLKEMVNKRAVETPLDIAFSYSDGKDAIVNKTCAELSAEIDALGTYFYSIGLVKKHIAIIGENSYEWLLAFFAIVNGGNVAVPIDKELSVENIEKMLHQSDCSAVIYTKKCFDKVKFIDGITQIPISEFPNFIKRGTDFIKNGAREFVDYTIDPEKLSIIAFTSGTTGGGKGVMLSQKNIVSDMNNGCRNFIIEGDSLAVLPFHHMFGLVVGTIMTFNYGCSSFICGNLRKLMTDLKVASPNITFLVPLFVETFYKQIWNTAKQNGKVTSLKIAMKISNCLLFWGIDLRHRFFKSVHAAFGGKLKYIICGGAALNEKYLKAFRTWGIEIRNAYGITECSPGIAVNRNYFFKDDSVGPIIPNCDVKINLDGEILVKGDNVMLGYYNDEKATSEVFVDGWYATGDLGYIDSDGFLFLTGRKKNLIILSNGENISPEEIEGEILAYEEVQEVIVYSANELIVAEIFPTQDFLQQEEHFAEIIKEINRKHPQYRQINKVKLRSEEFEKNSSKKILRHKIANNIDT